MTLPAAGRLAGPRRRSNGGVGRRRNERAETVVERKIGGRWGRRYDRRNRLARRVDCAAAMRPIGVLRLKHGLLTWASGSVVSHRNFSLLTVCAFDRA